tara:strand:- start:80 stop:277 length:198 start_codon:yes stop_codon:yes gene_type:complete
MIEKEEMSKKNINKSAIEMLKRMVDLENKDDRSAIMLEVAEWIFSPIDLQDELFLPYDFKEQYES